MSFLDFLSKQVNTTKEQISRPSFTHPNKPFSNKNNINSEQSLPSNNILPQFLTNQSRYQSTSTRSYATIFRSVTETDTPSFSSTPSQINHKHIHPEYKSVPEIFRIDTIVTMAEPAKEHVSQRYPPIKFRQMHLFQFNNGFESETCTSIINDFNKYEKQRIVPSKMNYQIYAECIHNESKSTKMIDKSVLEQTLKEVTVEKVDAQINTSNQYDNQDKKSHHSMDMSRELLNKQTSKSIEKPMEKSIEKDQSSIMYEAKKQKEEVAYLQLLKYEIENEKARVPRSYDYFENMENKLMELLKYVVESEGDKKLRGTNEDKIKSTLGDIGNYKGKKIDGELKIVQLQYFFAEVKELKNYKEEVEKNTKIKDNQNNKHRTEQKEKQGNKAIKIEQKPPELIDLSKKVQQQKRQAIKNKKLNQKTLPKKVEPRKYQHKNAQVPKRGQPIRNSKNIAHLSAIHKVKSQQDSWFGNPLNF